MLRGRQLGFGNHLRRLSEHAFKSEARSVCASATAATLGGRRNRLGQKRSEFFAKLYFHFQPDSHFELPIRPMRRAADV
jgi:hypothetical protein